MRTFYGKRYQSAGARKSTSQLDPVPAPAPVAEPKTNEPIDGTGSSTKVEILEEIHDQNSISTGSSSESEPGEISQNPTINRLEAAERGASVAQFQLSEQLEGLSFSTGMPVTQENGQRRCGPPPGYSGPPPPRGHSQCPTISIRIAMYGGSEVFIGRLPRDIYEHEIYPLFAEYGRIYEIRMMMDFSGTNRGYCFVHYFTPFEAARAIKLLNNYQIRPGKFLGVVKSVDNTRLFVGGIPKDKSKYEIFDEVNRITEGVYRIISYGDSKDRTSKNRGFAFIEYESHKHAAMARRKLIPGRIKMFGVDVSVDWADPEPEDSQNLHVRNLSSSTTNGDLLNAFNAVSYSGVETVNMMGDYAFVHFKSREQAEIAKHALDNTEICGSFIEINWARPAPRLSRSVRKQMKREESQMKAEQKRNRRIFGPYYQNNILLLQNTTTTTYEQTSLAIANAIQYGQAQGSGFWMGQPQPQPFGYFGAQPEPKGTGNDYFSSQSPVYPGLGSEFPPPMMMTGGSDGLDGSGTGTPMFSPPAFVQFPSNAFQWGFAGAALATGNLSSSGSSGGASAEAHCSMTCSSSAWLGPTM